VHLPTPLLFLALTIGPVLTELKRMEGLYTKRREVVKKIPNFWPTAFFHNKFLEIATEQNADKDALTFLEDIWLVRNEVEPRAFKLELVCHCSKLRPKVFNKSFLQHFKENPYFSDNVLIKDYSYVTPPNLDSTKDEHGLTAAQRDFDEERDVKILVRHIDATVRLSLACPADSD
jgi:template-activating factor I